MSVLEVKFVGDADVFDHIVEKQDGGMMNNVVFKK